MSSIVIAVAALVLSGCGGSAVMVTRTNAGGVLALDGDWQQSMADARRQMSEACGGTYTIVGGRNVVAGTYRERTISEYQIRFLCGFHPERQISPRPMR